MRRIRYKLSSKTMLMLYDTLIVPHINYCVSVWGGTSRTNLIKIHIIQKKALRLIVLEKPQTPSKPLFYQLRRLNIYDIHKHQIAQFMHSNLTGNMPYLLPNNFQGNSQLHNHATRSSTDIYVPTAKTNSSKFAFSICGPKSGIVYPQG